MLGAKELIGSFKEKGIVTILASGSIEPVLEHYKRLLNIDYIIGSRPQIEDGIIQGISENDYSHSDFKLFETKKILKRLSIKACETLAIGDSPGDKSRFMFAGRSIAINPKGDISKFSDHVIFGDLRHAIPIINKILETN
jgi:phosphoserine phosphatase